jgi:ferredoxin
VKVRVDQDRCQGHTLCAMIAPDSFQLDDIEGHASAITEDVAPDQEDAVREAAQSCPEQAILLDIDVGRSQGDLGRQGS